MQTTIAAIVIVALALYLWRLRRWGAARREAERALDAATQSLIEAQSERAAAEELADLALRAQVENLQTVYWHYWGNHNGERKPEEN